MKSYKVSFTVSTTTTTNQRANISLHGTTASSSRGQVFLDGQPLCNAAIGNNSPGTWDFNAANVVCKELGFSTAANFYRRTCQFGDCMDDNWIRSGITCTGDETSILDCAHDPTIAEECDSAAVDMVGVECREN